MKIRNKTILSISEENASLVITIQEKENTYYDVVFSEININLSPFEIYKFWTNLSKELRKTVDDCWLKGTLGLMCKRELENSLKKYI